MFQATISFCNILQKIVYLTNIAIDQDQVTRSMLYNVAFTFVLNKVIIRNSKKRKIYLHLSKAK